MAIAGTDTGSRLIGNMLAHHGEDLVQQFARQDVTVQMISGAAVMDLVASGEVPASPSVFRSHAQLAIGKGAPVRWVPLEHVTANAGGTALSANAPHPHAAMLWVDFALGEEGQRILQELDYDSPAGNPGFQRWYPEAGLTAAEIERKLNQWEDIVKRQLMRR